MKYRHFEWKDGAIIKDIDGRSYICLLSDDPRAHPPWCPFGTACSPNDPLTFSESETLGDWMGKGTQDKGYRDVLRIVQPFSETAEVKPPPKDSPWNGTCKCGANTYTGGWIVEHDGPCGL